MTHKQFKKSSQVNAPIDAVFQWHARPGAIERLSPPWDPLEIISRTGGIETGAEVKMRLFAGPVPVKWHARHVAFRENEMFQDIQIKGPFSRWIHTHRFEPCGPGATRLEDEIEFALPLHPLGTAVLAPFVEKTLERIFTYRHNTTIADIAAHQAAGVHGPKTILISGASGLLGSALIPFLTTGGHRVLRLVRRRPQPEKDEIEWNPSAGTLMIDAKEKIDAVIHLSGENIGEGRWSFEKKKQIIDSRVNSTRLLADTLAKMEHPPEVFLSASAIGFYGHRGSELMAESDGPGNDFISHVCQVWETSAQAAADAGIRTALLRIGIVLSPGGGALKKLLLPFQAGMGGQLGTGDQYMSWISIDDTIHAIYHAMFDPGISGPVNLVSPHPVTNREFTAILARVLSRPAFFRVPEIAIKTAFGEMGEETVLSSTRVTPAVLSQAGFRFRHPDLELALRHLLGKTAC